jgi:hypothetical protein
VAIVTATGWTVRESKLCSFVGRKISVVMVPGTGETVRGSNEYSVVGRKS